MARGKKAEAPKRESKAATSSEVKQQISARKLKGLLRACATTTEETRSLAGQLGEQIKSAIEHDNLDRVAFSILRRLARLSTEKLALVWPTLNFYMEISGEGERADSAPALDFSKSDENDEDSDEPTNVEPFPDRPAA